MLTTYPWDFKDPNFFKVGDVFGKTLYVTEFPSFNEQNLFFQELYEQTDDFKVSLFTKGVDIFRAQNIVEKQIQGDQGALWKRKNVMNFDAKASLDYRQSVLVHISEQSGHPFRTNPATHFGAKRPPVSVQSGHLCRVVC
jgi:hypothetical protein